MQFKPLILALGLALSPALQAANLGDIYREALANDTQYAAARAAYQAGLEALPQARSALLPQVGIDGNARYNDVRTSLPNGDTQHGNGAVNLNAVQPLFNKASSVQVDQAEEQVKIVARQLDLAGQDLILRTAKAYFDVLQAQDNVGLTRAQKAAITEELAAAKRNFEVGTVTIIDAQEAQARYDLAILDLTIPGGMGGVETLARLRQLDGNLKALASSGYCSDPVMSNPRGFGFQGTLVKPYTLADVGRVVAAALRSAVGREA